MKGTATVRIGICLSVFCMLALNCANLNLPKIYIITPDQPVIVQDAVPYSLPVQVSVPVPGWGTTVYPVDTATFEASLTRLLDGEVASQVSVTTALGSPVLDPDTGTYTWTGMVGIPDFGDYELDFTINNDMGTGANQHSFRLEQTVSELPAGYQGMTMSSLGQSPKSCLIPNWMMKIIMGVIQDASFSLGLPSGAQILAAGPGGFPISLSLPALGAVDVDLTLDQVNNDILMDGPDEYTIDLGLFGIPGFYCIITAAADGAFDDTDPNDLDGTLTVSISDVEASAGGSCSLNPPAGACDMIVGLDAEPY